MLVKFFVHIRLQSGIRKDVAKPHQKLHLGHLISWKEKTPGSARRTGVTKMFTFRTFSWKWPTLFAGSLFTVSLGTVGNAAPAESSACRSLPVIKNLTGLKARVDCHNAVAPSPQFNSRHIGGPTESFEDRVTFARSLRAKAQNLDAEAVAYEQAATRLGNGPFVKNLMAPTTPARYRFYAKRLREEAQANRELAASLAAGTALPDEVE